MREAVRGLDRAGLGHLLKAGAPGEGRARYCSAALIVYEAFCGGLGANFIDAAKKRLGLRGVKGAGYAQRKARLARGGRGCAGCGRERRSVLCARARVSALVGLLGVVGGCVARRCAVIGCGYA